MPRSAWDIIEEISSKRTKKRLRWDYIKHAATDGITMGEAPFDDKIDDLDARIADLDKRQKKKPEIDVPDAWKQKKTQVGPDWYQEPKSGPGGGHTPFTADEPEDDVTQALKGIGAKPPEETEVDRALRAAGLGSPRPGGPSKDYSDPKASAALRQKLRTQANAPELDRYSKSLFKAKSGAHPANAIKLMIVRLAEVIDSPMPPSPAMIRKYVEWFKRAQSPEQSKRILAQYVQELNK